jgi:hypothetical protein
LPSLQARPFVKADFVASDNISLNPSNRTGNDHTSIFIELDWKSLRLVTQIEFL